MAARVRRNQQTAEKSVARFGAYVGHCWQRLLKHCTVRCAPTTQIIVLRKMVGVADAEGVDIEANDPAAYPHPRCGELSGPAPLPISKTNDFSSSVRRMPYKSIWQVSFAKPQVLEKI